LFFGGCAILAYIEKEDDHKEYVDLTLSLWNKILEHLLGEIEETDLKEDDNDEDVDDDDVIFLNKEEDMLENLGSELSEESYDY
jgi:hypothetical protein